MAKDDMPVLFCKVLIYLYKVLKGKQERDEYYIQPMTNDFPISEIYLQTVLIELQEKGYIRTICTTKQHLVTITVFALCSAILYRL